MTDRPIIFSASMVRAKRSGRKTQTRRLSTSPLRRVEAGDRLWVREGWRRAGWCPAEYTSLGGDGMAVDVEYLADGARRTARDPDFDIEKAHGSGIPSIHMPRWASRTTLIVEEVRFQRLHEISREDAWAEGVCHAIEDGRPGMDMGDVDDQLRREIVRHYIGGARPAFHWLWDQLHDKPGERWEDNPAIVALTFRVVLQNIDEVAP